MKTIIITIAFLLTTTVSAGALTQASELIKGFEGYVGTEYSDVHQKAIGYGTSVVRARKHGYDGSNMNKTKASTILDKCMIEEANYLQTRIIGFNKLPHGVRAALISAAYNSHKLIGPKLIKFLNTKQYNKACWELAYGHNPDNKLGLVRRRFKEARHMARAFKIAPKHLVTPASVKEFNKCKKAVYPTVK